MSEAKFSLLNDEARRLNVYHVEDLEPYFADRKDKPSYRVFNYKKGKKTSIEGLKIVERDFNMSWYKFAKMRWYDYGWQDHEMIFYRGTVITAKETFDIADQVADALSALGVMPGDEVPCCLSNVPAVLFLMLAINKLGAKINCFGGHYDPAFIKDILKDATHKVMFATDDEYPKFAKIAEEAGYDKTVLISLTDYMPEDPSKCKGYNKEAADLYQFENKTKDYINGTNIISFFDFLELAKQNKTTVLDQGGLDTEFLITYTSGSTKIGRPKRMIHRNRSIITVGVFHDPVLCGNPDIHGFRGMALIHTDSNTNLITMVGDSLSQLWSVSFEPIYDRTRFLDTLMINRPNFCLATTNFWLTAARQHLIDKKYKHAYLPCVATMAVGEGCTPGEEKFINKFLRSVHAGSRKRVSGLFLPFWPIGMGGGDTEHGGVYYTLFHRLYETLNKPKLKGEPLGLEPVPFVQVTVLAKQDDGTFKEANYGEYGVIVANSATNMAGYRSYEKTADKIIVDEKGWQWLSCDVFGYVDHLGNIHMKDRRDSKVVLEDGRKVYPFHFNDTIQTDVDNLMTTVITNLETDGKKYFVINYQLSPLRKDSPKQIVKRMDDKLRKAHADVYDRILYREFTPENPFPVTGAGKRSVVDVTNMGTKGVFRFENGKKIPF